MNQTTSGGHIRAWSGTSIESCIRDGHAINEELRLDLSASRINRLARQYAKTTAATGVAFRDHMRAAAEKRPEHVSSARAISYPDPAGERAANRVDRERRRKGLKTVL